jgi:hypothetical protein
MPQSREIQPAKQTSASTRQIGYEWACRWTGTSNLRLLNVPERQLSTTADTEAPWGRYSPPELLHNSFEVAAKGGAIGVVGAEGGLADLQGPFMLTLGGGQVAKSAQYGAELAVPGCQTRSPLLIGLGDPQSLFILLSGAVIVAEFCSTLPSSSCRSPTSRWSGPSALLLTVTAYSARGLACWYCPRSRRYVDARSSSQPAGWPRLLAGRHVNGSQHVQEKLLARRPGL